MKRILVFLGKGGVGKTTSSASAAFYLAEKGFRVFWFSVDPAHNLSDVTGLDLSREREIVENLRGLEVDVEGYLTSYIEGTIRRMKKMYRQLSVVGLEGVIDSLKYSPGMEEVAILYAMGDVIDRHMDADFIVVDTPPTGLTLRILSLPKLNLDWLNVLRMWRLKILERRSMVASLKGREHLGEGVPVDPDEDPVISEIKEHTGFMKRMWDLLAGKLCLRVLVVNQDRLSVEEGLRIRERMKRLGMDLSAVLVNKFGLIPGRKADLKKEFEGIRIFELPYIENKERLDREDYLKIASCWVESLL